MAHTDTETTVTINDEQIIALAGGADIVVDGYSIYGSMLATDHLAALADGHDLHIEATPVGSFEPAAVCVRYQA